MRTKFSIVVACYNSGKYLESCLRSIFAQKYPLDSFEVICVDDGSTDGCSKILGRYRARYGNLVVVAQRNSGLEKACNIGIRTAQYPYVMRVDADDMVAEDLLSHMDRAIVKNRGYDFFYCKHYIEYHSQKKQYEKEVPRFNRQEIFTRGDFFASGTVYLKKDIVEAGYYPEGVKNCGLENYYLILRLLSRGKKGLAVVGAAFLYRRHGENMSTIKRKAIIDYGKKLLASYHRKFTTNQYHPYGLKLN